MRILLICTGNTCRSSMAEVLLRDLLVRRGLTGIEVASAGIAAMNGLPAADNAVRIMGERGLDLSGHRSRMVTPELLGSDLILTMTRRHRDVLLHRQPSLQGRVFTLKEFAGTADGNPDIADPFGGSPERYRQAAAEIEASLAETVRKLSAERQID